MSVTIRDLIDALEAQAERVGEDTPVEFVYQESYPLSAVATAITNTRDLDDQDAEDDGDCVYIALRDNGYGRRDVFDAGIRL